MEKETETPAKVIKIENEKEIDHMPRRRVSFYVKPKGSKRRKKVTFYARR